MTRKLFITFLWVATIFGMFGGLALMLYGFWTRTKPDAYDDIGYLISMASVIGGGGIAILWLGLKEIWE